MDTYITTAANNPATDPAHTIERPSEAIARRAAAAARWRQRIEKTVEAAVLAAVGPTGEKLPGGGVVYPGVGINNADLPTLARAWALIQLDRHGIGGPFGAAGTGRGTRRMPAFTGLGRGRWQAADGPAWAEAAATAAAEIEAAACRRRPGVRLTLTPEGVRVSSWRGQEEEHDLVLVPFPGEARPWVRALAAAVIAAAADPVSRLTYLDPLTGTEIDEDDLPGWARVVDDEVADE